MDCFDCEISDDLADSDLISWVPIFNLDGGDRMAITALDDLRGIESGWNPERSCLKCASLVLTLQLTSIRKTTDETFSCT